MELFAPTGINMIMNISLIADFKALCQHCQAVIDWNILAARNCFIDHILTFNEPVMIVDKDAAMLDKHLTGFFSILQVHANKTVAIC